jgi:hypothetical protein
MTAIYSRKFDPLDLEIIDRVYEAACQKMTDDLFRNVSEDEERKDALRRRVFAAAGKGPVDFDDLCSKVM